MRQGAFRKPSVSIKKSWKLQTISVSTTSFWIGRFRSWRKERIFLWEINLGQKRKIVFRGFYLGLLLFLPCPVLAHIFSIRKKAVCMAVSFACKRCCSVQVLSLEEGEQVQIRILFGAICGKKRRSFLGLKSSAHWCRTTVRTFRGFIRDREKRGTRNRFFFLLRVKFCTRRGLRVAENIRDKNRRTSGSRRSRRSPRGTPLPKKTTRKYSCLRFRWGKIRRIKNEKNYEKSIKKK